VWAGGGGARQTRRKRIGRRRARAGWACTRSSPSRRPTPGWAGQSPLSMNWACVYARACVYGISFSFLLPKPPPHPGMGGSVSAEHELDARARVFVCIVLGLVLSAAAAPRDGRVSLSADLGARARV
jgi:hypothetical protein